MPASCSPGRSRRKEAERISKLRRYLRDNAAGLRDYRLDLGRSGVGLRRTGAMGGNVDKLVVRRMKNQGMSWTFRGIRRMLCVRLLCLEGNIHEVLRNPGKVGEPQALVRKVSRVIEKAGVIEPHIGVLETALPALDGPHPNRPWVQMLKALARDSRR